MADKLQEMFDTWFEQTDGNPTPFQSFQGGVTASAVSMRQRAIDVVNKTKLTNDARNTLLTEIGKLSDIG